MIVVRSYIFEPPLVALLGGVRMAQQVVQLERVFLRPAWTRRPGRSDTSGYGPCKEHRKPD
jgi:hypothetical protein